MALLWQHPPGVRGGLSTGPPSARPLAEAGVRGDPREVRWRTDAAAVAAVFGCLVWAGCGGSPTNASPPCHPTAIRASAYGFPEVHGKSTHGQLWGLLFTKHHFVVAGRQLKVVWRMTGRGSLHLSTTGPHHRRIPLAWGPTAHLSSSYRRPGAEWGAGYSFPAPGCWRLHVTRNHNAADVWLLVRPNPRR